MARVRCTSSTLTQGSVIAWFLLGWKMEQLAKEIPRDVYWGVSNKEMGDRVYLEEIWNDV